MTGSRLLLLAGGIAIAVAAVWALFGGSGDGPAGSRADAGDAELVAAGRRIYAEACASCHGAALEGQSNWRRRAADGRLPAPPHDASGHSWHHDDQTLFAVTKHGPAAIAGAGYSSDMPAFGQTLSDGDIWAVLAYIKSTWPGDVQAKQMQITLQSEGKPR